MSALDTDLGFEAVFRKSANELKLRLKQDARSVPSSQSTQRRGSITAFAIFSALGLLSLGIFLIGYSALRSDAPDIWIHRLMALAIVQSILIAAVAMKLMPLIERRTSNIVIGAGARAAPALETARGTNTRLLLDPVPPPLPEPPKPIVGGQLAGREFLQYEDGSVEIDTLVGRRRFVSVDAAREFVGS
jgi:hypothetical protein